jgi:lipoprotein-anchoring transpeptidase ErfK/SrfK
VTYGCILLSNENAEALYNWAQEGVVVEIQA